MNVTDSRKGCPSVEMLNCWHDGEDVPLEVESHLDECEACRRTVDSYRRIDLALAQRLDRIPGDDFHHRVKQACQHADRAGMPLLKRIAGPMRKAAAVAVVGAGLALLASQLVSNETPTVAANENGDRQEAPELNENSVQPNPRESVAAGAAEQFRHDAFYGSDLSGRPLTRNLVARTNAFGGSALAVASASNLKKNQSIADMVTHVWVAPDQELSSQSRNALARLLPAGAQIVRQQSPESTDSLAFVLPDVKLQELVNALHERGYSLVSPAYPQPEEDERTCFTGKKVRYTLRIVHSE